MRYRYTGTRASAPMVAASMSFGIPDIALLAVIARVGAISET
ncbi:hypothetical protein ACO0LF_27605 [Undibacterium sp. Di27W]